jgi:hypothetical protein
LNRAKADARVAGDGGHAEMPPASPEELAQGRASLGGPSGGGGTVLKFPSGVWIKGKVETPRFMFWHGLEDNTRPTVMDERAPTARYEIAFDFDLWVQKHREAPRTGTYGSVEVKGPDPYRMFERGFRAFGWGIAVYHEGDEWNYQEGAQIAGERAIEDALWNPSDGEAKDAAFLALGSLTRAELMDGGKITRVVWIG